MYLNFVFIIMYIRIMFCDIIAPPTEGVLDWWQSTIIYEIFPMSFKDSNGDGMGDLRGITQKLDYLVDIGINAIWLTPFLESPFKSGGYDITDYLSIHQQFGTIDDFKDFLSNAHEKNLKVIMDFVPNHTSDEHVWFKKSINNEINYANYYVWKDAKNQDEIMRNNSVIPTVPNNWVHMDNSPAWIWNSNRKQFYLNQFVSNLPDLNYRDKNVHIEMKNILNYWLELGIDGIRIDALKHIYESKNMENEPIINKTRPVDYGNLDHIYTTDQDEVYDLIKEWHLILDEFKLKYNRTRILITESYSPLNVLFKYYTCGAEIPSNFNLLGLNYLHSPINYDMQIRKWITQMPNGATFNVVFQNHDHSRFPTSAGTVFINGLNALSLFLPGVAIVYYGGEIGMEDIPDESNRSRSPMQWDNTKYAGFTNSIANKPWIDVHPNYITRNVQTESNDPKSYLNFFKSVSRLRQTETLKRGGLATYIFNTTVFVINRFLLGNKNYTLVINMDSNSQHVRLSDKIPNLQNSLTVVFGSGNSNLNPGNSISTESLALSPGATIVLSDNISNSSITEPQLSSSTRLYIAFKVLLFSLCSVGASISGA